MILAGSRGKIMTDDKLTPDVDERLKPATPDQTDQPLPPNAVALSTPLGKVGRRLLFRN
jgi:hypothetical protein